MIHGFSVLKSLKCLGYAAIEYYYPLSPDSLSLLYIYTTRRWAEVVLSLFGCMPNDLVQFSQKSFLWGSSFLNTSTIGVGKASNNVLCRDKCLLCSCFLQMKKMMMTR
jgi:hypothetical protein